MSIFIILIVYIVIGLVVGEFYKASGSSFNTLDVLLWPINLLISLILYITKL